MPGDGHAGCGRRSGETHWWQHQQGAPGRPHGTLAQRREFREYLAGLLLLRDRNRTLTCLAGAEPVAGAQHAAVQQLQFFLSESTWSQEEVNARRLELLLADPAPGRGTGGR
ncbi:transposase [Streptomyces phaeochromogenes]|nr:hypothetical protein [Streptomyces phaeochromogenes]